MSPNRLVLCPLSSGIEASGQPKRVAFVKAGSKFVCIGRFARQHGTNPFLDGGIAVIAHRLMEVAVLETPPAWMRSPPVPIVKFGQCERLVPDRETPILALGSIEPCDDASLTTVDRLFM